MKTQCLLAFIFCGLLQTSLHSQNVGTTPTVNWNQLYTSGFYDSHGALNDPVSSSDSIWCWGVNIAHGANNPNYRYNGQILVVNNSQHPTMYIRSTNVDGDGVWGEVVVRNGNAVEFNSDLRIGYRHDPLKPRIGVHQSRLLGNQKGNFITLSSISGDDDGGNTLFNRSYIRRVDNGIGWPTMRLVDGIGIDASFTEPGKTLRAWWERNPHDDVQQWGNEETVHMTLNKGNLGIGNSSPEHKLDVAGTIRAQEVKIENTNWPDYVFSNDYQLPSLIEVSKHIEENKHLPGIPSAKEVEENGVNLGEMNTKLLEKIEELTLYMIQMQKEITRQQGEIEELKKGKL